MRSNDVIPGVTLATGQQYNRLRADALFSSYFLVHETDPVSSSVVVEGGFFFDINGDAVDCATDTLTSITPPATNPRIDVVSISDTGVVTRTAGTEHASPTAPATPVGHLKVAELYLRVGMTQINQYDEADGNGYIMDRRASFNLVQIPESINAPQGFLINGKIVTSVSSNNLTVAIKTLSGADAEPTNPIYCRIWNDIRAITWALSVTANAWTNWANAWSSELATQEIDYFFYLGRNATHWVIPCFSRVPYGLKVGDFSGTDTNEKLLKTWVVSYASLNTSDLVENVWRFNATLSAGASYNWSIPATSIIINRPTFETRQLKRVPTKTNSGTMGIANGWANTPLYLYKITGNMCRANGAEVLTLTTPATHSINFTAPMDCLRTAFSEDHWYSWAGSFGNGDMLSVHFNAKSGWSSNINCRFYAAINSGNYYLGTLRIRFNVNYPMA
jgi:hypothetical protein